MPVKTTDYIAVLGSAARTTTQTSQDFFNNNAKGVRVVWDITAVVATPSLVLTIDGFDPVSGVYFNLLTSAAKATAVTTVMTVYPGLTAAANLVVSDVLPYKWRIKITAGDTDSATYTVGASLLV